LLIKCRKKQQELNAVKQHFQEFHFVLESRLKKNIIDISAVTDEIASKVIRVSSELHNKIEKLADVVEGIDGKVRKLNYIVHNVQNDFGKHTEYPERRQGNRIEILS
jgi:archaellum component FlaC